MMRKMLPEGAVRQKMQVDGIDSDDIDAYFSGGEEVSTQSVALAGAPPRGPPPSSGRGGLLAGIEGGVQLRKAPSAPPKPAAPVGGGGGGGGLSLMDQLKGRYNQTPYDHFKTLIKTPYLYSVSKH